MGENLSATHAGFFSEGCPSQRLQLWLVPPVDQGGFLLRRRLPRPKRRLHHLCAPRNEPAGGAGQLLDREHIHLELVNNLNGLVDLDIIS